MFMDKRTEQAFAYLEKNEHSMMELLKNLVSIETPSADREANERIAAHLDTYCDALGMERQIHHFEKAGPTFAAWTRPQEKKPILLLGHMDTVHAVGKFGPEPFLVKDDRVYGPGVYDMKGGDVIALFVLRALNAVGYEDRQIKLVLTGDEEVAHAFSYGEAGKLVEQYASGCEAAFNLESSYTNGEVTTRRSGGAIIRVKVKGKAAHAGKEPQKGASAILQAARMITEIESRSVFGYLSFNCGRISGGTGANVIPDSCEFSIGIRYAAARWNRTATTQPWNWSTALTTSSPSTRKAVNSSANQSRRASSRAAAPTPPSSPASESPPSAASVSRAQAHIHLMSMRFRPHCSCSARNWWPRFWRCKMLCGS